jgi:hypothetical protein
VETKKHAVAIERRADQHLDESRAKGVHARAIHSGLTAGTQTLLQ